MNTISRQNPVRLMLTTSWACAVVLGVHLLPLPLDAASTAKTFSTPQELVRALGQAVNTTNRAGLVELFCPDSDWMVNPDPVLGATELAEFTGAFNLTQQAILSGLSDGDWVATGTTNGQPLQEGVPIKEIR